MKKLFCAVLVFLLLPLCVFAESQADAVAQLEQRRDELSKELSEVCAALGVLKREELLQQNPDCTLGKIIDLFPDETFACIVRDGCGKLSIQQEVSQEELDNISQIVDHGPLYYGYGIIKSLAGIGLLTNLDWLELEYNEISALPDEIRNCKKLKYIHMSHNKMDTITEYIGELSELTILDVGNTNISKLPDSIGNLVNLKYLYIGHTKITELPDSVWNLNLEKVDMQGLPIK